jgi:hypothetical protein
MFIKFILVGTSIYLILLIFVSIKLLTYYLNLCHKAKNKNISLNAYAFNFYMWRNFYWSFFRQHNRKKSFRMLITTIDKDNAKKYLFYEKISFYFIVIYD